MIEVLYLGGTIGMSASAGGWTPSNGRLAQIEALVAAGAVGARVRVTVPKPARDSAQFSPADWEELTGHVAAAQGSSDGVVVVQGTDTLAHTASWLALAAPGPAPVVVTGAQTPLAAGGPESLDGADNLRLAGRAALELCDGAWVAFGGLVLPGLGTTKTTTRSARGFAVPAPDCALAGRRHHGKSALAQRLAAVAARPLVRPLATVRVPVVAVHPGIDGSAVQAFARDRCAGLVLEAYGTGTAPLDGTGLEQAIRSLTARGVAVVVTSRCQGGRVDLGRYATGHRLAGAGAIDGHGLTSEGAQVVVCYLAAIGLFPVPLRALLTGPIDPLTDTEQDWSK